MITVKIDKLSHDGRGITQIEGKTAFISNALPNETVRCKITRKHRRYLEGETVEILTPSPDRAIPPCQHFTICGGCSLQHLDPEKQLQFKQTILLEQLKHFGKVEPEQILPPLSGKFINYRRKARLGIRYVHKKERVLVGFREKNSNYLAELHRCEILDKSIGTKLTELSDLIRSLTQFENIPQVEVAIGDEFPALVFRHMTDLPEIDKQKLCEFAEKNQFHIYLQPNPPGKIHKIWPNNSSETLNYTLPDYNLIIEFHPLDFTQVNGDMNRAMLNQALQLLDPQPHEKILDLFCGLGNFTLPIATRCKHVTGVEGSELMVTNAKKNAERNHLTNTTFYAANLMQPHIEAPWLQTTYDKILLDPPRTGAKEIIPFFTRLNAKCIVYVSCNPATLARDAGELVHQQNYRLKYVGLINMFPHTSHIETIAVFTK